MTSKEKSQFWLIHIKKALQSNISLAEYARKHHLSNKSIYRWKKVLTRAGLLKQNTTDTPFIKVALPASVKKLTPLDKSSDSIIVVFSNGHRLELPADALTLKQIAEMVSAL